MPRGINWNAVTAMAAVVAILVALWQFSAVRHDREHNDLVALIESVRTDLGKEIENVRTDLGKEIESVRTDLGGEIENVRADLGGRIDRIYDLLIERGRIAGN